LESFAGLDCENRKKSVAENYCKKGKDVIGLYKKVSSV
jgi:hypothetical protein